MFGHFVAVFGTHPTIRQEASIEVHNIILQSFRRINRSFNMQCPTFEELWTSKHKARVVHFNSVGVAEKCRDIEYWKTLAQQQSTITVKKKRKRELACKCGESSHKRVTHRDCALNPSIKC